MFQQNNGEDQQEPNPQQQQNNNQEGQELQNNNQDIQPNQDQLEIYLLRYINNKEQLSQQRAQLDIVIQEINGTPNDRFIYRQFLEKICNKFQSLSIKEYDDISNFEQLHQMIKDQYKKRRQEWESKLSQNQNLINDWNDKVKMAQYYQIMKILKSPNRSLYLTKDITKEVYFDEIKQELTPQEKEQLNQTNGIPESLKEFGIFDNYKVQSLEVFQNHLNLMKKEASQSDDPENFITLMQQNMCFEIYKILAFPYLYFNQCKKIDVEAQSVHFQLPNNMSIEVRSNYIEQSPLLNENSIMNSIPPYLLQTNILPFLSIIEVFKLRIVSRYFKTIVEKYWHIPAKKQIIDLEIAGELAYNSAFLSNFKIAAVTLKQKLRNCVDMIMNFINWQELHELIEIDQLQIEVYRPLIMMLRLFNKQQQISLPYEIDCQFSIKELAKDIKQQILDYLNLEFLPLSFNQMKQLQSSALSAPEFNITGLIHPQLHLSQLLTFLLQGLYFHGWMLQIITIHKELLKQRQKELQNMDEQQIQNRDFVRQARKFIYKMVDFEQSQDTEEQQTIMTQIYYQMNSSLKGFTFSVNDVTQSRPCAAIPYKNDVITIHQDIYCQIELLTYIYARQYIQEMQNNKQNSKVKQEIDSKQEEHEQQSEKIDSQPDLSHQQNEPN
ncbi:unnamed protein product (macronuclear) [Paramecium tetraurelia]|uniref:F-box domain-containing protein n=1 Tax=Paramecium tetraurelia TaxID=5888 RepID=A0EIA0_PARTE|nr:uncharacterized protein GSPATT00027370001 [Paramecium tetraurelia]CAK95041.1 unnamed protein product [Paramecium tetraurelia]|eukprot:XP_001462414.1 hypothetical protein (macronuclear) [Paramecium tetraurelia strain d4-2]